MMTRPLPNKTILRVLLAGVVLLLFCGAIFVGGVGATIPTEVTDVDTPEELTSAVTNDFNVKLTGNIELTETLNITTTGVLDLNGCVLSLKSGTNGSVISISSSGNLTLKDSNPDGEHHFNTSNTPWVWDSTETTGDIVKGGCITRGIATSGGGVHVSGGGTFTMSGGNIVGNTATGTINGEGGGGVYVAYDSTSKKGGTFTMSDGNIVGNTAKDGGGVLIHAGNDANKSKFTMSGGSIENNKATNGGGGVMVHFMGSFEMSGNASIKENSAYRGGGVDAWSGTFEMKGSSIENNKATKGGGVAVNTGACTFTMSGNASISGNSASWGGGVYVDGSGKKFTMSGGSITTNRSTGDGGGGVVVTGKGTFEMNNGTISGNTAVQRGGGVDAWSGTFTMNNGTISGNTAGTNGGGVYVSDGCPTIMSGGTIGGPDAGDGNTAKNGGGVSVGGLHKTTITFTMTGGTITGNTATESGGGVYVPTIGIFNVSGTPVIRGNTDKAETPNANNVYIVGNAKFHLANPLENPAEIHITYAYDEPKEGGRFGTAAAMTLAGVDRFVADVDEGKDPLVGSIRENWDLIWVKGQPPGPETFSVTYNKNGGDEITGNVPVDSASYFSGDTVTVLGNTGSLAKEGFEFSGWTLDKEGAGFVYRTGDTFTITENTTLYAKWTKIPAGAIKITFNANGGSGSMSDQHVTKGGSVLLAPNEFTAPTDPKCQVFAGWTKTQGGKSVDYRNCELVSFTEDTTLYAVWKTEHSIVNIDHVDPTCTTAGHSIGEQCSVCDTTIIKPTTLPKIGHNRGNPVKENYTPATETQAGSYDLVVYCTHCGVELERKHVDIPKITTDTRWTVTYYGSGADKGAPPVDSTEYPNGADVTVKDAGTLHKTGYTFGGWKSSAGSDLQPKGTFKVTENTELYAVWNPNTYTIHFNANGGAGTMADQNFTYGQEKLLLLNDFEREGYAFAGWAPAANVGVKYENQAKILNLSAEYGGEITLYAIWNPLKEVTLVKSVTTEDGITTITKPDEGTVTTEGKVTKIVVGETRVTLNYTEPPTDSDATVIGTIDNFKIDYKTSVVPPPTESQITEETATVEIQYLLQNLTSSDTALLTSTPTINAGVDTDKLLRLSRTYKIGGMFSGRADDILNNELKRSGMMLTFYLNREWVENRYGKDFEAIKKSLNVLMIPDNAEEGSVSIDSDVTYENGKYVVRALTYKGISTSYAVCADPIYYDVTFNPNGGTWSGGGSDERKVTILENTPLAEKDWMVPVKEGDEFEYWCTSSGKEFDMASPVTGDIILYAKWKGGKPTPTLTVTYDANGGTGDVPTDSSSYPAGSEVTVLGNTGGLAKDGFNFSGWTLSADGTGNIYHKGDTFTITKNTTLYAKWTEIPETAVTITFNANGGKPEKYTQNVTPNTSVPLAPNEFTAPDDPKCLVFAGWATTQEKAQAGSVDYRNCQSVIFTENTDLYAVWKTEHSIVNIDRVEPTCTTAGHSIGEECSVCHAKIIEPETLPATGHNPGNPVKENYTPATAEQAGSYDLVVYCTHCKTKLSSTHVTIPKISTDTRWTVTYYGSGADKGTPPVDSTKYPNGADVTVKDRNTLQKTGYTFGGWKSSAGLDLQPEETFKVGENTELYAVWNPIPYTIRFDKNGGEGTMADQTFTYDDETITLNPNTFTRDGYVFAGWAPNTNVGVKYSTWANTRQLSGHAAEGNIVTLYAVWNPVTQLELVTSIHKDGGTTEIITDGDVSAPGDKSAQITVDETTVTLRYNENPTVSSKKVSGKISNFDINYKTSVNLPPTESQTTQETATAEIKYDIYNLTDTAFLIATPKITAGIDTDKLERLSSTYKIGGMFSGRADDILNNELKRSGMMLTFYLSREWVENRYGKDPEVIKKSLNVLMIPDNAEEGSVSIDSDVTYENGKYVVRALTYKGISTSYTVCADPIYYDVTFNPNGGTWSGGSSDERKVTILENTPLSERDRTVPVKDGDKFICWRTVSGEEYDMASPVTGDITLYAKWEHGDPTPTPVPSTATVTFDVRGHGTNFTRTVDIGSKVPRPSDPSAIGYTFGDWYTDAACTSAWDFNTSVTKDIILYAKWTANTYTVTFDFAGAQKDGAPVSVTASYGEMMPGLSIKPEKYGYSFTGHYDAETGGYKYYTEDLTSARIWDKAEDTTLYAQWTPNEKQEIHPEKGHADIDKEAIPVNPANRVFIESVENVSDAGVLFNADDKVVDKPIEAAAGYTKIDKVYTVFQIDAEPAQSGGYVKLTVKAQLSKDDKPENVILRHYKGEIGSGDWESRAITQAGKPVEINDDTYNYQFVFNIPEFSPFALTSETPVKKNGGNSTQGSSIWLTATPTPTSTETPTPEMPTVKPVATETPAKSPMTIMGLLAGLGAAAAVFGLRRK